MQVWHKLEDIPAGFGPTLLSVGNFDGVHRAHTRVLADIVARARELGYKAVAVTFEPHPARILRPDSGLKLLTPDSRENSPARSQLALMQFSCFLSPAICLS